MTCGPECFAKVGMPTTTSVIVRDLWRHSVVATVMGEFNSTVASGGASAIYVLSPATSAQ
jgi:hypothetical protein